MNRAAGTRRPGRLVAPALLTAAAVAVSTLAGSVVPAAAADNLVANGGFETSLAGWVPNIMPGGLGATLSQVAGGHSGSSAVRVTSRKTGLATLNDSPDTVASTTAFMLYTGTAQVRTSTPGVTVSLRVQELSGGVVGASSASITLNDTAWHEVSVVYTAATTGSALNFNAINYSLPLGKSFDVDSVSLVGTMPETDATNWNVVYRNDFVDLRDVSPTTTSPSANSTILPSDVSNAALQKPTVRSNVAVSADPAASDGMALGVHTRQATYATNTGSKVGWANGRMTIDAQNQSPPVRVTARMRFTASAKSKAAVMWWPAGGGWPWEVDFAETFGGNTITDAWGSRQRVAQRWHKDINGDGQATEQLIHDDVLDATQYHVYDLVIQTDYMSMTIDGVKTFETRDTNYIPDSAGFVSIGKALTGTRDAANRTNDAVYVDWLQISKPGL